ncbi:site-specific integrase [Natrialba taiwanensis]|uniref:Bacterio-opsin activator-like protein n=1 Tax=Natrialba taiwanensis DSM 12281 TaxID=1230458 RepID=L9ZTE6_9EURY|nr:site-specific integrase [Natrialba taiwanensis]ELY89366.1 bacterio-opsin activator-like protein [Natrialba taiwanensis DSM 12281]
MVRVDDSDDVTKCWLSPGELDRLERAAGEDGWEREVAIQLMGRCGLRASEVSYPSDSNLRYSDDGDIWLFEVQGKNTKGGSKKTRDAWMPDDVADDIHKYSRERGLDLSDRWVDASTPSVRRWVNEATHTVAEQTDNPRWRSVSSHDLRRSWATYHLVERQVDVRTMMSIGGWSDYSAIEPYLAEPTEARIGEAMRP